MEVFASISHVSYTLLLDSSHTISNLHSFQRNSRFRIHQTTNFALPCAPHHLAEPHPKSTLAGSISRFPNIIHLSSMIRMVSPSKPIFPIHPLPLPPNLSKRPVVLVFLVLLLLRSRALSLPKDAIASLRRGKSYLTNFQRRRKLTKEELAKVLQQVYIDEPDGSQTLLVPYRERVVKVRDVIRTNLSTSRRLPILLNLTRYLLGSRSPNSQIPIFGR